MNVTLREVYQTSADGEKFWKMKEMFIKGNVVSRGQPKPEMGVRSVNDDIGDGHASCVVAPRKLTSQIKYFRIADSVLDQAAEEQKQLQMQRQRQGNRGMSRKRFQSTDLTPRWTWRKHARSR